jgi:predicted nucleotidyltransferase
LNKNNILLILKEYKNQYAEKYGILSLGLFGSLARDESGDNSDVDISITLDTPDLITLSRIRQELEELIKIHVDLIHYRDKMNKYLKERIERETIYV